VVYVVGAVITLYTTVVRFSFNQMSKVLNIEPQNKKPQNDEVITSIFPPEADSTFCGSKRRSLRGNQS
jgi:hypothetical protein